MPIQKFTAKESKERLLEESMYEQAAAELARGEVRNGLWIKAASESDGDDTKTSNLYLKYRVQSLKDEIKISHSAASQEKLNKVKKTIEDEDFIPAIIVFIGIGAFFWWILS